MVIFLFCEVRWLSRCSMLASVFEMRNEFASFLKNKSINITAFQDTECLSSLEFLVHLTSQLHKQTELTTSRIKSAYPGDVESYFNFSSKTTTV